MFKRSLASVAAVAVVSGAVVAPANAVTVKVNNDRTCTIEQNDKEAQLTNSMKKLTLSKENAAQFKAHYLDNQLSALEAEIEADKKKLDALRPDAPERERLKEELKKKKEKFTANKNFSDALGACAAGNNYDSSNPGPSNPGPSNPGPSNPGPSNPGPSNPGPSNPGPSNPGPSNPGPSNPGPSNPEGERALPSTNGAVIGVIVAVLGILAAALPVIKSILRALLP